MLSFVVHLSDLQDLKHYAAILGSTEKSLLQWDFFSIGFVQKQEGVGNKNLFFVTARQQSCGKVMLAVMSVCLSFCLEGSHVTIAHDALDLTVLPPPHPGPFQTWEMGTPRLPSDMEHENPPATDIWWPSLLTCSNLFIGPHCIAPTPS